MPEDDALSREVFDELFVKIPGAAQTNELFDEILGPFLRACRLDPAAAGLVADPAAAQDLSQRLSRPAPAALLSAAGDIEVFWSSTQHGGWSVVLSTLAVGTLTWGASQQVAVSPYAQRAPLAVGAGPGTLLVYRSNESIAYTSGVYSATSTLDHRYAGTTTVDTGGGRCAAARDRYPEAAAGLVRVRLRP